MDFKNGTAAFVMPHWSRGDEAAVRYLDETVQSLLDQTDSNWKLIIVDDLSPSEEAKANLKRVQALHPDKISLIFNGTNNGPGYCRNTGIQWAKEQGCPFVIFIDADDLSDKKRVEVARKIFIKDPSASVVYTTFKVIDEHSNIVPEAKLSPSIMEIINSHKGNPPMGPNAWVEIGTTKGYTNLTSATAVKTDIASAFPFPPEKVSEDSHTWLRYSAGGDSFVYTAEGPTLYRIPQDTAGSASRTREGGKHGFYLTKARVDEDGFKEAVRLGVANKKVTAAEGDKLMIKFYIKLGDTMAQEQEMDIAEAQIAAAAAISKELTVALVKEAGFAGQAWAQVK
jgi:glycosyltransferase involved in cell wall biosynthesis